MDEVKKGRGCFFYGCLTLVVVVIVGALVAFFGGRYAFKKLAENYSSEKPVVIAPLTLPKSSGDQAVRRVEDFKKLLNDGKAAEPLVLTSEELDYVIRNSKPEFRDAMHVAITNDQIVAQISIPSETILQMIPVLPMVRGRYFNGNAGFDVDVLNGTLLVDLKSMEFNGQPLPQQALDSMRQNMRAQQPANDLRNLEKIEIKDGKLTVFPKVAEPAPTPAPTP